MSILFFKTVTGVSGGDNVQDVKPFSNGTQQQQSAQQTKLTSPEQQQQQQRAQQVQQAQQAKQAQQVQSNQQLQKQQQKAKKKKPVTPEHQLLLDVQSAAKAQNPTAAVAVYHAAIAAGTPLNPNLYSTLLYLCAGGESWELPLRQQLTETSPLVEDIMQQAAADVAQQEESTAVADEQAIDTTPTPATATAVAEPGASTSDSTLPSPQAATADGHATAVASSDKQTLPQSAQTLSSPSFSLISRSQTSSRAELATADAAATSEMSQPSASKPEIGRDGPAAEMVAETLPALSPAQLSEEGRAIFDKMQVRARCFNATWVLCT